MKKNHTSAFSMGKPVQLILIIGSVILLGVVLWGVQNGTFELRQKAAPRAWPTIGASITCYNADKTVKGDCTYCTEYKCTKKQTQKWGSQQKICLESRTNAGVCVSGVCVTDGSASDTCPVPSGAPPGGPRRLE